ncbi:MAG: hypothetical protein ACE5D6_03250 [Candidatus Zixiibacteriota bacterium]
MINGLPLVITHRNWYVPDFQVWGTPEWGEFDLLMIENVESQKSILFDNVSIDDSAQEVKYQDLVDFRGNNLPVSIKNPKILIKPKSENTAFIVGNESNTSFKVAHNSDVAGPVKIDILIVEMGT